MTATLDASVAILKSLNQKDSINMYQSGTYATNETDLKDRYIIWNPGATQPPTVTYPDRPTAIRVAHLMANKNPGKQFAVCKIVGSAKPVTVKYEDFEG